MEKKNTIQNSYKRSLGVDYLENRLKIENWILLLVLMAMDLVKEVERYKIKRVALQEVRYGITLEQPKYRKQQSSVASVNRTAIRICSTRIDYTCSKIT